MGLIKANITLRNPLDNRLAPYEAEALVDTGSLLLCFPEHVAVQLQLQLQLQTTQQREVATADGQHHVCPYVGPIEINFGNRTCFTGALILGEEVLLGAVPMEDLDVIINPAARTIVPNPESPNLPFAIVK